MNIIAIGRFSLGAWKYRSNGRLHFGLRLYGIRNTGMNYIRVFPLSEFEIGINKKVTD